MGDRLIRFGIIGAGGVAQAYAHAFEVCAGANLVAVADVRPDAARALAERGDDCRSYDSYEALAADAKLDAVVVCTPPVTHEEICLHFLRRKVHVLCEKPLSIGVESARRMLDAAEREGVLLTMASKFRYVEDVARAKSLVASGVIGEVVLFENTFTSHVDMSSRWNSRPEISGGGVLIDNGTHSVDLTRYFLGPLAEVQVVEGKRSQGLAVEETVRMTVRSVEGVLGAIDLSWSIDKESDNYVSIYGSHGTVRLGWRESKYRQASEHDWVVFGSGYDKVGAFSRQIENFSRAILGHEPLRVTAVDALASVEVIEAAYVALRQHQWTGVGRTAAPLFTRTAGGGLVEDMGSVG
ncbi:MAG: Gfo/Idh/MocA family oxidoreductase [Rubrivivax sp.]|nr:Gfo/Idh/MocA family oxidoreductase [Pyrinomonadaceae bacterium]